MLAEITENLMLVLAVAAIVLISAAYYVISKKSPRGTVLAIAVATYVLGVILFSPDDRWGAWASGVLKLSGFVGLILGVLDLGHKREVDWEAERWR